MTISSTSYQTKTSCGDTSTCSFTNGRAGTASAKTRGEVSGGGKKPYPQKHTGRARQGSIRAIQWKHGGVAHAPKPRNYLKRLNKKMKRLAPQISAFCEIKKAISSSSATYDLKKRRRNKSRKQCTTFELQKKRSYSYGREKKLCTKT